MDNIITSIIGAAIFLAFVFGLAGSINTLPFTIIVTIVASMLLYNIYEEIKDSRKNKDSDS